MPSEPRALPLGAETRRALLALAREAIRAYLQEGRRLRPGRDFPPVAPHPRGAFVTLKTEEGDLRGCIGTVLPAGPLDATVARMAVSASVEDPRFGPVGIGELPLLRLEISALTVPEPVPAWDSIEVGRHGLIVSRAHRKGLLLPQVAVEWGWDREELLRQTCMKAGLPPGAWRESGTLVEWFEAEVWGEES
ncbi:MAG: AmmeMemoRadiSam system protein A [Acidobacteriota bacterium]